MLSNQITVKISVVVPLYNEEENIDVLFSRLLAVLEALNTSYSIENHGIKDKLNGITGNYGILPSMVLPLLVFCL